MATWGYGLSGCLGHGNYESCSSPKWIESVKSQSFSYIESGGYHNGAMTNDSSLYMWGRGDVGQLGFENSRVIQKDEMGYVLTYPKKSSIKHVKQISLGEAHTLVLDLDNTLYAFGWGELGQLGVESTEVFHVYKHKQKFK